MVAADLLETTDPCGKCGQIRGELGRALQELIDNIGQDRENKPCELFTVNLFI